MWAEVSLGRRLLEVRPRLALMRKPRREGKYKGEQRALVSG